MALELPLKDVRQELAVSPVFQYEQRNLSDITSIAIHHSMTLSGNAKAISGNHVHTKGWAGIGYTYVVKTSGLVEFCLPWESICPHVGTEDFSALAVCVIGDFRNHSIKRIPNEMQLESLFLLLEYLRQNIPTISAVKGHCEYEQSLCPGFDMGWFRKMYDAWRQDFNLSEVKIV